MATWACNKYGGVKTLGLCHGEIHGEMQIAEVLGIPREELDITCAGINHQTWYVSVKYHGKEMLDKILPGFEAHEKFREEEKVRNGLDTILQNQMVIYQNMWHGIENVRMKLKTGSIWIIGLMGKPVDICV